MAAMPRGQSRTVPDPAGELYDQHMSDLKAQRLAEDQGLDSPLGAIGGSFEKQQYRPRTARPNLSIADAATRQTPRANQPTGSIHYLTYGPTRNAGMRLTRAHLADAWTARGAPEPSLVPSPSNHGDRRWTGGNPYLQLASTGAICGSCHGAGVSPPPPSMAKPAPPAKPVWGVLPDSPWKKPAYKTPQPPREHPPQCAMQNMSDSRICARQPNRVARAMCFEDAAKREAYCIKSRGEVGYPDLFTID